MIEKIARAMARVEGFGADKNNRPTRNNNPGNIEYHDWMANKYKCKGSDGRFAIFATPEEGFKAMIDILSGGGYRNLTVQQIVTRWNGTDQPNNKEYCKMVCQFANCSPLDVPSSQLVTEQITQTKEHTHNLGIVKPSDRKVV